MVSLLIACDAVGAIDPLLGGRTLATAGGQVLTAGTGLTCAFVPWTGLDGA
jgi:hypothetical protein